jgi:enoyl-ACP reductase-like protein
MRSLRALRVASALLALDAWRAMARNCCWRTRMVTAQRPSLTSLSRLLSRRTLPVQRTSSACSMWQRHAYRGAGAGAVDTPMWRKIDAEWSEIEGWRVGEAWKRRTSLIPLGRPETPEDVAGVVSFLASRDSDYMTGRAGRRQRRPRCRLHRPLVHLCCPAVDR